MKNSRVAFILLSILSQFISSIESSAQSNADILNKAIVFLSSEYPLTNKSKCGSGTIIVKGEITYIVTATHVSKYLNQDSFVILQDSNGIAVPIKISDWSETGKWMNHEIADLSVLKLLPKTERKNFTYFMGVPADIVQKKKESISREIRLTVFGFPLALGALDHVKPVTGKTLKYLSALTYNSFPSSGLITLTRSDTTVNQEFIALENPSTQGYSGGPVFDLKYPRESQGYITYITEAPKLIGFIHGTVSDNTGGKITLMTPSSYLWDLIK